MSLQSFTTSPGAPSAPTSVTITSTFSTTPLYYIKPTQTVRIRWSGAAAGTGGSITGYKIWYRQDNAMIASFTEVSSSLTSGYTDISISGYTRGAKLIVSVGTKGTGDLYSDNKRASTSPTVNKRPTITTASFNQSAIISGDSATINLKGFSGDSEQSVSYKYAETSSGTKYSTSNGASFSFTHTGNDSGTYGKYFYAYDGVEYSISKYASIIVHSVLTASLSSSQYETSTSLGGIKYLKKGTFKIKTNKTNLTSSNITATVGGIGFPIKDFSQNSTLITVTIDFRETTYVADLYVPGKTIPITFTINAGTYNGVTNSKTIRTDFTTGNKGKGIVFGPDKISILKHFSLSEHYATGDINSELFNEKIKLKTSEFDSGDNSIKNLAYSIVVTSSISSNGGDTYTKNKDLDYTSTEDDVSSLQEGTKIKYNVAITDTNGVIYYSETPNILTKVIRPYIKEDEVSYIENSSPNIVYYPTSETYSSNSQTQITIQIPTTNIYINGIMLSTTSPELVPRPSDWVVKFNDEINLDIAEVVTSNNGYIYLKIDITNEDNNVSSIISAANSSSLNKNSYHDASLSISFTDNYGLESDFYIKQSMLKIDFREKPVIESFKIYHSMKRNYNGDYSEVISNDNTQKVNPDEYIKFSITVTDDNVKKGEESYDNFIYIIKRKDLLIEAGAYVEIARGNLITSYDSDSGSYYGSIEYPIKSASVYYEIKKYKYKVEVTDTSNLSTSKETNFDTPYDLICFPTNSSPDSNITTTFDKDGKFIITLGDNLCGYDNYFNYKNLERGEYTKDFKIAVFSSSDYDTILNLSKESWSNNNIFTESALVKGYNETIEITKKPEVNSTTYYRIGLKISTGLNVVIDEKGNITTPINYIYTWSKIYSIDPNNPVVSIRKNYLGINTGSTIDSDNSKILLQVNALSSGSRKKIILYGPPADETTPEVTIEIDLTDGSINGATISGGEW